MTCNQTILKVNTADMKARFSGYLDRVIRGETIIVCRRNLPIAELRPIARPRAEPRPIGIDRGMKVPNSFFEALPLELLEAFEGKSEPR